MAGIRASGFVKKSIVAFAMNLAEEKVVEETITRKTTSRTITSVTAEEEDIEIKEGLSRDGLLIELIKFEAHGLAKDYVIRWGKDKKLDTEEKDTLIETLEQFDDKFLKDIYEAFTTGKSGWGLEVRFAHWLKRNSSLIIMGNAIFGEDPVKLRHWIQGNSSVNHEVDVFAKIDSKFEGRSFLKKTIHPGAIFLISCKSTRSKVNKQHVAEWISIARDILTNEDIITKNNIGMVGIVSRMGFTPDTLKFAYKNPIQVFGDFNPTDMTWKRLIGMPVLLFEQIKPTKFKQLIPNEKHIEPYWENLEIDLEEPGDVKQPKEWSFTWFLPDMMVLEK